MPGGHRFETGLGAPRKPVEAHDHAVLAYTTEDELATALGAFVREGSERKELIVFVHALESDEAAWDLLALAAPGIGKDEGIVVVSLYEQAFEGGAGRIDHDHVQSVVGNLIDTASARGRAGTRIFVDASRRYLGGGRADEWFRFERWLGRKLAAGVGLICAYRRDDIMREEILPQVLETHSYRFEP